MSRTSSGFKGIWERFPYAPEIYWHLVSGRDLNRRPRIQRMGQQLADWVSQARLASVQVEEAPKKVLMFTIVPIWVKHSSLLASAFAGLGHEVTLAYLPHEDWFTEESDYQLKLRNYFLEEMFKSADGLFTPVSWYQYGQETTLPADLHQSIKAVCDRDYQYTHQVEEVDESDPFMDWRLESNFSAAKAAYAWMQQQRPEVVLVPNGSILEFGAVYEVASYLGIRVVTYEFGEQLERIWLAQDQPVMLQDTNAMWSASKELPFSEEAQARIRELYASRMQAGLWQNFSRQWQDAPTVGGEAVRENLGLDGRPLVLMAANVIGDSLTLGRQVFSESMTEWIERTLAYFSAKEDVQFILRIHPGERFTTGPSVEDIVRRMVRDIPGHIRIISAKDPVNTYDLISAADLGIVYTTTVGMEMAMLGVPSVVVGKTHYRGKGFTHDPESWEAYFALLDRALTAPDSLLLSEEQIEQAWHYAHNFFFEYPRPFPWHLRHLDQDVDHWKPEDALSDPDLLGFRDTFNLLAGEPPAWKDLVGRSN